MTAGDLLVITQTATNNQTVMEYVGIIALAIALDTSTAGAPAVDISKNTESPTSSA